MADQEIDKYIHNWEDEGISVQKGRWGKSMVVKGKLKFDLPKTVDANELSLDDVKKMIDEKSKKAKK